MEEEKGWLVARRLVWEGLRVVRGGDGVQTKGKQGVVGAVGVVEQVESAEREEFLVVVVDEVGVVMAEG